MIKGTKAETIIQLLKHIPKRLRQTVEEITLDMAASINLIARHCFSQGKAGY
jgi:hypothetical protein